ncbi:hypothetical protein [uncultured Faecalibaculum sp.]|uniref:hypothetical protein n=1 Tax=uncultured Faecalibaculum sp. TaxID=1729681 RepID=UPI002617C3F5|nr:hypothetical protein [uncultured Faecalibaculum sp.]
MPIGHHVTSFCEQYELEEAAAHLLYAYLFTGLGGEDAERILFGDHHQKGWFTKTLLNFYGLSNSRESMNRGRFKGYSMEDAVRELTTTGKVGDTKVASLFLKYRPDLHQHHSL